MGSGPVLASQADEVRHGRAIAAVLAKLDNVTADPLLAQRAYDLMVGQLGSNFEPWDQLTDTTRGAFKERAAQVQSLPIFEQCVAQVLLGLPVS